MGGEAPGGGGEHARKSRFGGGGTERTDLSVSHSSENVLQEARDQAWYSESPGRWLEPSVLESRGYAKV